MKKFLSFVLLLALPLIGGQISSVFSGDIAAAYASLEKPFFSPPGWVFPLAWLILYALMGIGSWLVYQSAVQEEKSPAYYLLPYALQLIVNFCWAPVFFGLGAYKAGTALAVVLLAAVVWMILRFARINITAAFLQLPYLLWCIYAVALCFGIVWLN